MHDKRVAIILPSGGCKCAFQAGALLAVEELIPVTSIVYIQGCSGGALNGAAFLENGCRAQTAIDLWRGIDRAGNLVLLDIPTVVANQFVDGISNRSLKKAVGQLRLDHVVKSHIELEIVVRNLTTNQVEVFSTKDAWLAQNNNLVLRKLLVATASIPGSTSLIEIPVVSGNVCRHIPYCDGFVWVPERLMGKEFDLIIVIDPEHEIDPFSAERRPVVVPRGAWGAVSGSNYIYFDNLAKSLKMLELIFGKEKIVVIKPNREYPGLGILNFKKGQIGEAIDHGYERSCDVLRMLKS